MRVPMDVLVPMMLVWVWVLGMLNVVVGMRVSVTFVLTPRAMMVMMPMRVSVSGIAASKHVESEQCDGRTRSDAEPRIELVWNDILRGVKGNQAERVDACGVCRRHNQAEE